MRWQLWLLVDPSIRKIRTGLLPCRPPASSGGLTPAGGTRRDGPVLVFGRALDTRPNFGYNGIIVGE
jgi:hypothetical protein